MVEEAPLAQTDMQWVREADAT